MIKLRWRKNAIGTQCCIPIHKVSCVLWRFRIVYHCWHWLWHIDLGAQGSKYANGRSTTSRVWTHNFLDPTQINCRTRVSASNNHSNSSKQRVIGPGYSNNFFWSHSEFFRKFRQKEHQPRGAFIKAAHNHAFPHREESLWNGPQGVKVWSLIIVNAIFSEDGWFYTWKKIVGHVSLSLILD